MISPDLVKLQQEIASLEVERSFLQELAKSVDNVPDVIPYQCYNDCTGASAFSVFGKHIPRIADYTAEEALADYFEIQKRISAQDTPEFIARAVAAARDSLPFDFTSYHRNFDGSVRRTRLHANGEPEGTGVMWWHGCLSEVEADDETIVEEENSQENIGHEVSNQQENITSSDDSLDHLLVGGIFQSIDMLLLVEPDGTILSINEAFSLVTGRNRFSLIVPNILEFLCDDHVQYFLQNGVLPEGEVQYKTVDGGTKTVIQSSTPIYENGELVNFIIVARDISRQLEFNERLNKVRHLESMGTLASGIAHDLNNILQAIMIFASCTEEDSGSASSMIVNSCERAATLVSRVLSHTRKGEEQLVTFDAVPMVNECLELININKDFEVSVAAKDGEISAYCDTNDFRQLIVCLCSFVKSSMSDIGNKLDLTLVLKDRVPTLQASFESPAPINETAIDFTLLKGLVTRIGGQLSLVQCEVGEGGAESAKVVIEIVLPEKPSILEGDSF